MDVAVTELRAHLSDWLQRARQGDEVVITDRGVPVARLLGLSATAVLERLAAEGVIGQAGGGPAAGSVRASPSPSAPAGGRHRQRTAALTMPLVYFDSSALVKLLTEEEGSDLAAELWDGCDAALASRLAYPEVRAALAASARNHDLDNGDLADAEQAFDEYWAATRPVELTAAVERHAGLLAGVHALRGADAVHLASALAIADPDLIVAVWDRRLHAGAAAAGLLVAPA